ncbi:MAG TPA: type II secretion system protein [Lacunisphaera sp.]|nr:type II secretion system protein [Lacunisphaera sp.]
MTGFSRRTPGRRAFTLIEVILAIALLGLVASLFITGGSEMFRARERTMTDVFWEAVQAARLEAVQGDTTVTMRFDEKSRRILWGATGDAHGVDWPGRNLEFLPMESGGSILLGGQLAGTGKLGAVRFHPDGTTDRYRVQLTDPTGQISRLELDPWTTAPVLRATP